MAKNSITDYSKTAASNTDIQSVDIAEGCLPSGINNAIREIMADLADMNDGTVSLTSPAFTSVDINGGTIDGTTIGGTTPAAGTFTTGQFNTSLNVDGTVTADGLTVEGASNPVITLSSTNTTVADGDLLGGLIFQNSDSSGSPPHKFGIIAKADDAFGDGSLFFYTNRDGLEASETPAVYIGGKGADENFVGIGTSSPTSDLTFGGATPTISTDTSDASDTSRLSIGGGGNATSTGRGSIVQYHGNDHASAAGAMKHFMGNASGSYISWHLGSGTEAMRIDSSGNVGIGTSSPSAPLHVVGNSYVQSGTFYTDAISAYSGSSISINAGSSHLAATVNGSERLRINSSGNVGINTSSPAYRLSVSGTIGLTDGVSTATHALVGGNYYIQNTGAYSTIFQTNATERMRIDSSGNVGIGTSSPNARLDVVGSSQIRQQYTGASNGFQIGQFNSSGDASINNQANANLLLATNNTERMRIDSSGNVGIGTSSPADKLHVEGNIYLGASNRTIYTGGSANLIFQNNTGNMIFSRNNGSSESMRIDSSGNVGIGTSSPIAILDVKNATNEHIVVSGSSAYGSNAIVGVNDSGGEVGLGLGGNTVEFYTAATERMRINSDGDFMFAKTTPSYTNTGIEFDYATGRSFFTVAGQYTSIFNRKTNDGIVIYIAQDSALEGSISVSGTTVSYNGGHLARWSQLTDGTKDEAIVKGTVMTNLDQMAVWSHDASEAQDAYTEDNEQLNCMAVSSVEGDPNVAGVFVNWDNDDDQFNDMNIAMTGDMVIRIAQDTTVTRGDLLMSAGDGTAKPQGDDIVRSKTIAKVTSTNVSHTYDDGSYCVPCVLMAC